MQRSFPTSEGQSLELPLAGPGSRSLAFLWDIVVVVIGTLLLAMTLGFIASLFGSELVAILAELSIGALLLSLALLATVCSLFGRRTPGKFQLGLDVLDASGAPASAGQHFVRGVAVLAEMVPIPIPVGFLVAFLHPEQRRLGDLLANTYVVQRALRPAPAPKRARERRRRAAAESAEAELAGLRDQLTPATLSRLDARDRWLLVELRRRHELRIGVLEDLEKRLAVALQAKLRLRDHDTTPDLFLRVLREAHTSR